MAAQMLPPSNVVKPPPNLAFAPESDGVQHRRTPITISHNARTTIPEQKMLRNVSRFALNPACIGVRTSRPNFSARWADEIVIATKLKGGQPGTFPSFFSGLFKSEWDPPYLEQPVILFENHHMRRYVTEEPRTKK